MSVLNDAFFMTTDSDEQEVATGRAMQPAADPFFNVCSNRTLAHIKKLLPPDENTFANSIMGSVMLSLAAELRPDLFEPQGAPLHAVEQKARALAEASTAVDVARLEKIDPALGDLTPTLAMYAHGAVLCGVSSIDRPFHNTQLVGALALSPINNGVEHKNAINWLQRAGIISFDVIDPQNSKTWRQETLRLFAVSVKKTAPLCVPDATKKRKEAPPAEVAPDAKKSAKEPAVSATKSAKMPTEKSAAKPAEKPAAKSAEKPAEKSAPKPKTAKPENPAKKPEAKPKDEAPKTDYDAELARLLARIDDDAAEEVVVVAPVPVPVPAPVPVSVPSSARPAALKLLQMTGSYDAMRGVAEQFKWDASSMINVFGSNLLLVPNRDFQMLLVLMREKMHDPDAVHSYATAQFKDNTHFLKINGVQVRPINNPLAAIFSCARVNEKTAANLGKPRDELSCHENIVAYQRNMMHLYCSDDGATTAAIAGAGEMATLSVLFGFLRLDRRLIGRAGDTARLESAELEVGSVELDINELPMGTGFSCGAVTMQLLKKMWQRYCEAIGFKAGESSERFLELRRAFALPAGFEFFADYWSQSFTPTPEQAKKYNLALLPIMYALFPPLRLGALPKGR